MIDLHNHILPALDDGAATLDESLEIARQFVSEGVTSVAATPHLDPLLGHGAPADVVRERVDELCLALRHADIPLDVQPGHELFLTTDAPALLRAGHALCLGSSSWVLVELSLTADSRPLFLDDVLFQLQVDGYRPILAHPERYPFMARDAHCLDELVARGVALQLTAPALLGHYGRRIAALSQRLLQRGVYSLAASDRHHPDQPRSLAVLHRSISDIAGETAADLLLVTNPALVLADGQIDAVDPAVLHRRWWRSGRRRP